MSFETSETSLDSGQPLFLFTFSRTGRTWRYTNVNKAIVYGGYTFAPLAIKENGISQESGGSSDDYRVTMPSSAPLCQYLDAINTSFPITLLVHKAHVLMGDDGEWEEPESGGAKLMWAGNLVSVSRPSISQRELTLMTMASSMKRGGLRLSWGRNCPHMLYGRGCLVNKASYATTLAGLIILDGVTLQCAAVDALADGWFSGGFVEWEYEGGLVERTAIESHVGDILNLMGTTQGMQYALDGSMPFVAYAGCDRTADTCHVKFNNILNHGGIEYLQGKSPFRGEPIF